MIYRRYDNNPESKPACIRSRQMMLFFIFLAVAFVSGCGGDAGPKTEEILKDFRLDLLKDEVYLMPANTREADATLYLPLKKWDMIFVGGMKSGLNVGGDPSLLSLLIPGVYDHVLIYAGKDAAGYAYAIELNTDRIYLDNLSVVVEGGHRFLCLGRDFGRDLHPTGENVIRRDRYAVRWAKRLEPEKRRRLLDSDEEIIRKVRADILAGFPYQLEFRLPANLLIDRKIYLVDDGLENGAGCADYWTALFERHAGVCIKGARISASELEDYYVNDPEGKTAYIPEYLNILGSGRQYVRDLIGLGLHVGEDPPHRFTCDGTFESGLVIPDRLFGSAAFEEIPPWQSSD